LKFIIFSALVFWRSLLKGITGGIVAQGHSAELEHLTKVKFKNVVVGEYEADLLVDDKLLVELKGAKR